MARTIRSDRSGEPASTPPSRRTGSLLIVAIGFLFTAWSLMELLAPGRDYQTHRLEFYSVDDIRWLSPDAARVGGVPLTTESQADGTVRHRIELTAVHLNKLGDTHFPALDRAEWTETFREHHGAQGHTPAFDFVTLVRKPVS